MSEQLKPPTCSREEINTLVFYIPWKEIMTSLERLESNQTLQAKYSKQSLLPFVKMLLMRKPMAESALQFLGTQIQFRDYGLKIKFTL